MSESNCCGAKIHDDSDICSCCGEHCSEICEQCGGEGWVEEIDYLKVNSATIDIPYKRIICDKCDGERSVEIEL